MQTSTSIYMNMMNCWLRAAHHPTFCQNPPSHDALTKYTPLWYTLVYFGTLTVPVPMGYGLVGLLVGNSPRALDIMFFRRRTCGIVMSNPLIHCIGSRRRTRKVTRAAGKRRWRSAQCTVPDLVQATEPRKPDYIYDASPVTRLQCRCAARHAQSCLVRNGRQRLAWPYFSISILCKPKIWLGKFDYVCPLAVTRPFWR